MPRNYGDPVGEYQAARNGAVVIDREDRVFLRVHGRDPIKMVQGLITNDLASAPENRAVYAGVLTPKGKLVGELRALRSGNDVLIETAASAVEPVIAHFKKFIPPLFARFEASDHHSMLGVYGPRSRDLVTNLIGSQPADVEDEITDAEGIAAIRTSYTGEAGWDLIVDGDPARVRDRLIELGAMAAGQATLEVLRIEAGSPRWDADLDENVIPLEAGLRSRMISETKGCYTGQEIIIRILHRGHVNRHLRGLLLGDAPSPAKGTELLNSADRKVVGRITSACASPRFGQTIALGYVRREVTLPGSLVLATGAPLIVVELPFAVGAVVGARES
ncbi:MAG: glycine cleavage T C-terminal barrel domain-containing protein [Gemmatimonadota bacterium]